MRGGWARIADLLVSLHGQEGEALVSDTERGGRDLLDVGPKLVVPRRELKSLEVRRWMWDVREEAERADCVWSRWDGRRSTVGLGMMVT